MQHSNFQVQTANGPLNGRKFMVNEHAPCVILACGHNGFYHYGMFPTIQDVLAEHGFSSVTFNYSHSGISDDRDSFDQLDRYEKNCRRLEKEDLLHMINLIHQGEFIGKPQRVFLLGHSMGGFSATFAAHNAVQDQLQIDGLILVCSLRTLDVRTNEVMEDWKQKGVYLRHNPRTNQWLPQGSEFLSETLASQSIWNMETVVRSLKIPLFIAHATNDEAVPFEHGRTIFSWSYQQNSATVFFPIPNAGHTLNTIHPAKRDSEELQLFLAACVNWMKNVMN